jgi:hypothetical protein
MDGTVRNTGEQSNLYNILIQKDEVTGTEKKVILKWG